MIRNRNRSIPAWTTAALLLAVAGSPAAHAQLARTWVSVNGNDGNDCSRATPCRTLGTAFSRSSAGGEIDVLDSGDFGTLTITRSVSVIAPGVLGGIQVGSGTAITVNAGASDKVVLRGLALDGLGTGANGVTFTAGGLLYVESCTINNFSGYGINFAPAGGSGKLVLTDTVVRNNGVGATGGGVFLLATTGTGFVATVDGLRSENNVFGLRADTLGVVTVRNSLAANNGFAGFSAVNTSGSGTLRMMLEGSVAANNGTGGINSVGSASVGISNVVATGNQTGVNSGGTVNVTSFGENRIWGNGTDVTGTITNIGQQ